MSTKIFRDKVRAERKRRRAAMQIAPKLPTDYHWKVAGWVLKDTSIYLPPSAHRWLHAAITGRDVDLYLAFCDAASLQSISLVAESISIETIRSLRFNCFLEKFLFPGDEITRDSSAIAKFLQTEEKCSMMNHGDFPLRTQSSDIFDDDIFKYAQEFCAMVLTNKVDIGAIYKFSRFGPGSDTATVKQRTALFDKLQPPLTVTKRAETHLRRYILDDHRWLRSLLSDYWKEPSLMCTGYGLCQNPYWWYLDMSVEDQEEFWDSILVRDECNEISTVPKNSKISRDMALEPSGNMLLQLGVDGVVRRSLKAHGIDLNTQDKNRRLALLGSLSGKLTTIDMSSASNLISIQAVKFFLPPAWFEFLMDLRCPQGRIDIKSIGVNETILYEKISSMGNGYTFVLETLIYASLVYGVIRFHGDHWRDVFESVAIYGDDIILPLKYDQDLMRVLVRSGFKVNSKKTFRFGYIRESCGKDYYKGYDIRGPHLEDSPKTLPDVMIHHNVLCDAYRRLFPGSLPVHMLKIRRWVPTEFRFVGPEDDEAFGWFHDFIPTLPIVYHEDYQCFVRITNRLRKVRSPVPLPRSALWYYGRLQHTLNDTPLNPYKDIGVESSANRFRVLGRNCPIIIKEQQVFLFT